jgi:hypothetical protein
LRRGRAAVWAVLGGAASPPVISHSPVTILVSLPDVDRPQKYARSALDVWRSRWLAPFAFHTRECLLQQSEPRTQFSGPDPELQCLKGRRHQRSTAKQSIAAIYGASTAQHGHPGDEPLKSKCCAAVASHVVETYLWSGKQVGDSLGISSVLKGVLENGIIHLIIRVRHTFTETVNLNPSRFTPWVTLLLTASRLVQVCSFSPWVWHMKVTVLRSRAVR